MPQGMVLSLRGWQQLKRGEGASHTVFRLQMDLMCWNVDIVHQNDHYITDVDYWLQLGAKVCFDPLLKAYLDLTRTGDLRKLLAHIRYPLDTRQLTSPQGEADVQSLEGV